MEAVLIMPILILNVVHNIMQKQLVQIKDTANWLQLLLLRLQPKNVQPLDIHHQF